jgi:hypothetical protein
VSNATRAPIYDLKGYRLTWANTSGVNADGTSVGRPENRRSLLAGSYLWFASFELSTPVSSLPARFNLTNRDQFAAYVEDVLTSASFASRVRQEVAHKTSMHLSVGCRACRFPSFGLVVCASLCVLYVLSAHACVRGCACCMG